MSKENDWRAPRRVTLADVGARAGVSRALVSIVMRDAPGASQATRERVRAAALELGYRPDVRARALAGQQSRLLGVMFGVAGTFHFDFLDGLYAAAEDAGYGLVLSALTHSRDEKRAVQSLQDFRFDALIMLEPATPEPLMAGQIPLVAVGWRVEHPDVDSVRTSDELGMVLAVNHLADLGHRSITHIDGGSTPTGSSRREAYIAAMRARGLGDQVHVIPGGVSQFDGQKATAALLDQGELPSALVAYNDDVAVSVLHSLAQHGIGVPEQISVMGWDDNRVARLAQLTSITQQPDEMARLVVERLVARLNQEVIEDRDVVLDPELVVRSSTAPSGH